MTTTAREVPKKLTKKLLTQIAKEMDFKTVFKYSFPTIVAQCLRTQDVVQDLANRTRDFSSHCVKTSFVLKHKSTDDYAKLVTTPEFVENLESCVDGDWIRSKTGVDSQRFIDYRYENGFWTKSLFWDDKEAKDQRLEFNENWCLTPGLFRKVAEYYGRPISDPEIQRLIFGDE